MSQTDRQAVAGFTWASYHIFYYALSCHQVLLEIVLPVVRDLWNRRQLIRFFFIRYGEGGPHVRLRVLGSPEGRRDLESSLRTWMTEALARHETSQLND